MRSSGFGLGKKQPRNDEAKKQPPKNSDLTTILGMSQKTPDRAFFYNWQAPDGSLFNLNVISHGAKAERRGWTVSAVDSSAIQDADWKLYREVNGVKEELFNMQTSDAYLVQSVIDEILADGSSLDAHVPLDEAYPATNGSVDAGAQPTGGPPAYGGAPQTSTAAGGEEQRGNIRNTPVRVLLENYLASKATGHLIVDTGTVTSDVFFQNGEPVHAKSIHSIYKDRDMVGDNVILDLFTWTESDYKFRPGVTSPTRSVHTPTRDLLAGKVNAAPASTTSGAASEFSSAKSEFSSPSQDSSTPSFNSGYATGPTGGAASGAPRPSLPGTAAPPIPLAAKIKVNPEDFSNADDLIGETFSSLIEPSGMLKYGMFLMLARTEFARHELSKSPFCIAAIGIETPTGGGLSDEGIGKVQECFESAGQPLDTITAATNNRFFALFPHSSGAAAATSLKHFLNNVQTTNLESGLHGGNMRVSIGLCDVPRDGNEFETVMLNACKLRRAATPDRRIVLSAG